MSEHTNYLFYSIFRLLLIGINTHTHTFLTANPPDQREDRRPLQIWKTQTIHSNTLGYSTQTFFRFQLIFFNLIFSIQHVQIYWIKLLVRIIYFWNFFFLFRAQIWNDMQIAMEAEKLWKFLGIFLQIELMEFAFFSSSPE